MMNRRGPATIGIRETGVFGSSTLEGSQEIPGLDRSDYSISVSGVFVVPLDGRLEAKAFGGPSDIRTRLDLIRSVFAMPEFDLTPDGRFSNVRLSPIRFSSEQIETSGWGYHVGGTVAVFLMRVLGVGATITY
jgi:hypothetical protein